MRDLNWASFRHSAKRNPFRDLRKLSNLHCKMGFSRTSTVRSLEETLRNRKREPCCNCAPYPCQLAGNQSCNRRQLDQDAPGGTHSAFRFLASATLSTGATRFPLQRILCFGERSASVLAQAHSLRNANLLYWTAASLESNLFSSEQGNHLFQ